MRRAFRRGAVGAMMDEYERSAAELGTLVGKMSEADFARILDPGTENEECRSARTIVSHVVWSGYSYADYLRKYFSMAASSPPERLLARTEAEGAIGRMIGYTAVTLEGRWEMGEEEIMSVSIDTRWGQRYDVEQLLEHAIVHVLRHRRQIERLMQAAGMDPP